MSARVALRGMETASGTLHPARAARAEADVARALALRPLWAEAWADAAVLRQARGDVAGAARRSTVPARSIPRTCRWGSRTRTSSSGSTARARPSSSWSGSGR